jgi:hypothetical protein
MKRLSESVRLELQSILGDFGDGTDAVRELAEEVVEMSVLVTAGKIAGQDVSVAELALVASTRNLASIATIRTSRAVLDFAQSLLVRIMSGLVQVVLTAV